MNASLVASRYAKALLLRVGETGGGPRVYAQARALERAFASVPSLRDRLDENPGITGAQRRSLLQAAVGDDSLAPELEALFRLMERNGRMPVLQLTVNSFIRQYLRSEGKVHATLRTVRASRELEDAVRRTVSSRTGWELELDTEEDPSLLGGFVLEVEDLLLDASVKHQLDAVRRAFAEQNRRIV